MEVKIKNFRSHDSLAVSCSKADSVYICGKNGSGKSDVYRAITWCLFPKKSDKVHSTKTRSNDVCVRLTLQGLKIKRTATPNTITVYKGTNKYVGADAEEIIRTTFGSVFTWNRCSNIADKHPFMTASSTERMTMLNELVGITKEIRDEATKVVKEMKKRVKDLEGPHEDKVRRYEITHKDEVAKSEYILSRKDRKKITEKIPYLEEEISTIKSSLSKLSILEGRKKVLIKDISKLSDHTHQRLNEMIEQRDIRIKYTSLLKEYEKAEKVLSDCNVDKSKIENISFGHEDSDNALIIERKYKENKKKCKQLNMTYTEEDIARKLSELEAITNSEKNILSVKKYDLLSESIRKLENSISDNSQSIEDRDNSQSIEDCHKELSEIERSIRYYPEVVKLELFNKDKSNINKRRSELGVSEDESIDEYIDDLTTRINIQPLIEEKINYINVYKELVNTLPEIYDIREDKIASLVSSRLELLPNIEQRRTYLNMYKLLQSLSPEIYLGENIPSLVHSRLSLETQIKQREIYLLEYEKLLSELPEIYNVEETDISPLVSNRLELLPKIQQKRSYLDVYQILESLCPEIYSSESNKDITSIVKSRLLLKPIIVQREEYLKEYSKLKLKLPGVYDIPEKDITSLVSRRLELLPKIEQKRSYLKIYRKLELLCPEIYLCKQSTNYEEIVRNRLSIKTSIIQREEYIKEYKQLIDLLPEIYKNITHESGNVQSLISSRCESVSAVISHGPERKKYLDTYSFLQELYPEVYTNDVLSEAFIAERLQQVTKAIKEIELFKIIQYCPHCSGMVVVNKEKVQKYEGEEPSNSESNLSSNPQEELSLLKQMSKMSFPSVPNIVMSKQPKKELIILKKLEKTNLPEFVVISSNIQEEFKILEELNKMTLPLCEDTDTFEDIKTELSILKKLDKLQLPDYVVVSSNIIKEFAALDELSKMILPLCDDTETFEDVDQEINILKKLDRSNLPIGIQVSSDLKEEFRILKHLDRMILPDVVDNTKTFDDIKSEITILRSLDKLKLPLNIDEDKKENVAPLKKKLALAKDVLLLEQMLEKSRVLLSVIPDDVKRMNIDEANKRKSELNTKVSNLEKLEELHKKLSCMTRPNIPENLLSIDIDKAKKDLLVVQSIEYYDLPLYSSVQIKAVVEYKKISSKFLCTTKHTEVVTDEQISTYTNNLSCLEWKQNELATIEKDILKIKYNDDDLKEATSNLSNAKRALVNHTKHSQMKADADELEESTRELEEAKKDYTDAVELSNMIEKRAVKRTRRALKQLNKDANIFFESVGSVVRIAISEGPKIKIACTSGGYDVGKPTELSKGEQSLVSLALIIGFASYSKSSLLILDEATDKLSVEGKDRAIGKLLKIMKKKGKIVLLTDHNCHTGNYDKIFTLGQL